MKVLTKTPVRTEQQIQDLTDKGITVYWRSENSQVTTTRKHGYRVQTRVNDLKYLLTNLDTLINFTGTADFYYIEGEI